MAEFCVKCFNELNETNYPEKAYEISREEWLCEGCREYKRVVIGFKTPWYEGLFPFIKF